MLAVIAVAASLPRLLREGRGANLRPRLTPALLILTGGAAVTLASYLVFKLGCDRLGCHRREGHGFAKLDDWWHGRHSWEWAGQVTIAAAALTAAALAFWLSAGARRGARHALWSARLLYAAWVVLVFVVPVALGAL